MTKNEYDAYIEALERRDYQFVGSHQKRCYCKVIKYRKDEDGDSRAVCQLLFYLFEREDNRSGYVYYYVEPLGTISRNIEERLDFIISNPKRSIEECEHIAKEFLRLVDINIDIECNEYFNINQNNQENGK